MNICIPQINAAINSAAAPQSVDQLVDEALRVLREIQADAGDHLMLGTACGLASWRHSAVVPQLEALTRAAALVEENLARG